MINWNKIFGNNNSVKQIFNFSIFGGTKKVENKLFDKINRDIDNLDLDLAVEGLDIIKDDFEYFSEKQKSNYFLFKARVEDFLNLFKYENKNNERVYYENLIKSGDYLKNDSTLLNKAVGLYGLGDKEGAREIIEDLYKKGRYNELIYGFYLVVKKDEYGNFEDFIKILDEKYKDSSSVKQILGNIYKNMGGNHIEAFDKFYKQDYGKIEKFYEKVIYFRLWAHYLENKYSIYNLSEEGRNSYLEFDTYIDTFINDFEGKKLFAEIDILNQKAIINSKIKGLPKIADYFFNKAFEKKDSGIIRVNRVLNLLNIERNDDEEIFNELEDIISKLNFYLEQEKGNPNKSILYQVHTLLAQEYFLKSNKEINLSNEYKEKGLKLLKEFKENYYDKADLFHQRIFGIVDIQSEPNKAKEKIIEYLNQDNCIIYNLLAFNFIKDYKYIEEAYKLYKEGKTDSFESVIQLADTFLIRLNDERSFFDIIDSFLKNISQTKYFRDYIISGINLNEIDKVNKELELYKGKNGFDYNYTILKAYLEKKRGNKKSAIEVLDSFGDLEKHIDLLFWKSHFQYSLGDESYKNTLNKLCEIGEKAGFKNFKIKDKLDFISSYWLVNQEEAIKICYNFLQEDIEDKFLLELKKIYFKIFLDSEQNGLKFSNNEINEDSIITIKNLSNDDKQIICMDGYSKKIYGFDKVLSVNDEIYSKLFGKNIGDEIINPFGDKFGVEQKYKIIEIKHKYNYLQSLMFSRYSDEVMGALKVEIPTKEGEADFTNFLNLMDHLGKQETDRKKYIDENFTNKGLLTFKVLNHFYGKSYTEIYYQQDFRLLLSDQLFKLNKGDEIVDIVIDPSSIISIFELGVEGILKDNFNIYISQSTFESFNNELTDFNNSPKSKMSVFSDGEGHYGKIEMTEEHYENRENYLTKIVKYLKDECKIAKSDLLLSSKQGIDEILGNEFYDSLLIAKDNGYYLFSDEQLLRRLARNEENNVQTFGIESFLIYLNTKKKIYPEFLLNSYIKLLNLGFRRVLINAVMIYYLLVKENVKDLNAVISYVKNENNDIKFIVSSLIYSISKIHSYKGEFNGSEFGYTDEAKKYYFRILYKIILKYFDKKEIDKLFYELVIEQKLPEIKQYMDDFDNED